MLYSITVLAQTRTITGKIASNDGQPIEGASVRIQGSHAGTVTNVRGEFKIVAKDGRDLAMATVGDDLASLKAGRTFEKHAKPA